MANSDKRKEQNRKVSAAYRLKNKEKLAQKRKENYKKNGEILRERNRVWASKPEVKIKRKEYNKAYREEHKEEISIKRKPYNKAYHRLSKSINKYASFKTCLQNRLDERKVEPTEEQIEWMHISLAKHCWKFRKQKDEMIGEAWVCLLETARAWKAKKDKDSIPEGAFFFLSLKYGGMRKYNCTEQAKHIKNGLKIRSLNAENKDEDDSLVTSISYSKEEDPSLKLDADYLQKIIKKKFIEKSIIKSESSKRFKGKDYYNIWYDHNINSFSYNDLIDKYNLKDYKSADNLLVRIKGKFKEIQAEIVKDNPSWYG